MAHDMRAGPYRLLFYLGGKMQRIDQWKRVGPELRPASDESVRESSQPRQHHTVLKIETDHCLFAYGRGCAHRTLDWRLPIQGHAVAYREHYGWRPHLRRASGFQ